MEKIQFAKSAIFLAIFSIIGKIIGAVYRIPLTNILGSEGMGLYQLVFPIFVIALSISSTGISLTVTKMVAESKTNSKSVFMIALKTTLIISGILTLVFILLSGVISKIQGNISAEKVYWSMSCTILIVSVLSVFRGYLKGREDMKSFAVSEILEQILKLGFGLGLAIIFLKYGVVYAVVGSFLGIGVAAFVSLIYVIIKKKVLDRKLNKFAVLNNSKQTIESSFFKFALFSSLCSIVFPLTQFIDSILVVNLLMGNGLSSSEATKLFGLSAGVVSSIINLPLALVIAIETVVLPSLSRTSSSKTTTQKKSKEALFLAGLVSLPCALLIMTFAKQIISILYWQGLTQAELLMATSLLKIGGMSVFFLSMLQISTVIFQGEGKFHIPLYSLLIGAVCKFALMFILIPKLGVFGAEISVVAYYFIVSILNLLILKKEELVGGDKRMYFALLVSVIVGSVSLVCNYIFEGVLNDFLHILFSGLILIMVTTFVSLIYLFVKRKKKKLL